jgi:acetate kinase
MKQNRSQPIINIMKILTVNVGSSSLRLAAFACEEGEAQQIAGGSWDSQDAAPIELLRRFITEHNLAPPDAVVHRIVHGGAEFSGPCLIDDRVASQLEQLMPLAPLHNGAALQLIHASRTLFGSDRPQVAVFDTGFYRDLPPFAANYALPAELVARQGLRRYGFHGLAHQALWQRWSELQAGLAQTGRIISLQLGSGCSITAIRNGKPVDTSMGFTPLEGLVMATRCGDLDPGLMLYLQRNLGIGLAELDDMLNRHSGLLGVSGLSPDMRVLLAADTPAAHLAIGLYCYRASKYIGAYLAALGGADSIVFGGGVGENAPAIRTRILANLGWAGIHLDPALNRAASGRAHCISRPGSPVTVWVLAVDEERIMAEQTHGLLSESRASVGIPGVHSQEENTDEQT